jgi:hypothetical protein
LEFRGIAPATVLRIGAFTTVSGLPAGADEA